MNVSKTSQRPLGRASEVGSDCDTRTAQDQTKDARGEAKAAELSIPGSLARNGAAIERTRAMESLSSMLLGHVDLKGAQRALRITMSELALERCGGSRRAAAALLGVDRRYVQRLAHERKDDARSWESED